MADTPPNEDLRLVRILAPAALLREVDGLVRQGRAGYQTRQEFFLDAVENHLLEVKYGGAEGVQRQLPMSEAAGNGSSADASAPTTSDEVAPQPAVETPAPPALADESIERFSDLVQTELHPPARGAVIDDGIAEAANEPLFGLHNRDYPSLWAAQQLALQTQDGFVPLRNYVETTVREAWRFAASLEDLEAEATTKLTALFPKNWSKPQSAEESFKTFAIGGLAKKPLPGGKRKAGGPLYTWGLAQLRDADGQLEIGMTAAGYALLEQLDGISLRLPHEEHFAQRFFDFLAEHASADAAGFDHLLEVVPEGVTRTELAARFKDWKPDWSETVANTNAAAFVARAREWGLLEEKLIDGRYALTEFGERQRGKVTS